MESPPAQAHAAPTIPASPGAGWHAVVLALFAGTAACFAIERYFEPANLITVYLAAVTYVALRSGRAAALWTVFCSLLLFDLLFVEPRWSLKPTDPQYFFSFAVMLAVGLLISHLATRARRQAAAAEIRARRTQALNELALQLARARGDDAIASAVEASVRRVLGREARLLPAAGAGAGEEPAEGHARHGLVVPLYATEGRIGTLAVAPAHDVDALLEDDALLTAIANQAAVALERGIFERRSAKAAVEADRERLRSTLLAGISHDFRTPLTTIVGAATSLIEQHEALDDAHREALLRSVLTEAQRLHALSSDLLDLTRMEEGSVRPESEWCPVDDLVDEARAALGSRLDAHPMHTELATDAVVWCDPRLLGQALVNLLDNAVRHTPPGTPIEVVVRIDADTWLLQVRDEGPGIPAGQEQEVFRKFYRGWRPAGEGGTGLGLAICAVVATLHGGGITARNAGGACFELRLPQPSQAADRPWETE